MWIFFPGGMSFFSDSRAMAFPKTIPDALGGFSPALLSKFRGDIVKVGSFFRNSPYIFAHVFCVKSFLDVRPSFPVSSISPTTQVSVEPSLAACFLIDLLNSPLFPGAGVLPSRSNPK